MTFPHPSAASRAASGCMLLTRCLPRIFDGLAVMPAILGSFYWLGFETPELSSGKKRLALLGAQRYSAAAGRAIVMWRFEVAPAALPVGSRDLFGDGFTGELISISA